MGLEKALLSGIQGSKENLHEITVRFNPEKYTLSLTNSISNNDALGKNSKKKIQVPKPFSQTFSTDLIFDTYEEDQTQEKKVSVQVYTDKLKKLISLEGEDKKPLEKCRFKWGKFQFDGIITNSTQNFTMFLEDGTPVRAKVSITMTEIKDPPKDGESAADESTDLPNNDDSALMKSTFDNPGKWRLWAMAQMIANPRL